MNSDVDKVQQHQEQIEKRLACKFNLYLGLIVSMQSLETFFVLFHKLDSSESIDTTRYKLGWVCYMIFFFV